VVTIGVRGGGYGRLSSQRDTVARVRRSPTPGSGSSWCAHSVGVGGTWSTHLMPGS